MPVIGAYVHQFEQQQEKTIAALAASLKRGGITEVRFKSHQHLRFTGYWDSGGAADIESLEAVQAAVASFQAHGIRSYPWCCPMGLDVEAEAQLAAKVARIAGRLDFDVEPYSEFWPGLVSGDVSAVAPYFKRVRELVGSQIELTLDFPARMPFEWPAVQKAVALATPFVDRLALQSYFGLAQAKDAESRVRALVGSSKSVDHISDVPHLAEMASEYKSRDRLLVWRAADLTSAGYATLAQLAGVSAPVPDPNAPQLVAPKLVAPVKEQNQFSAANYDTAAEFAQLQQAMCSAASLAAVLTAYGEPCNISEARRRITAVGDRITADGLNNVLGQSVALERALDAAGIQASRYTWEQFTRHTFMEVLDSGRPIICQVQRYLNLPGGHYFVATGVLPDRSGVLVADSNAGSGKRTQYHWDGGFGQGLWTDMAGGTATWADLVPHGGIDVVTDADLVAAQKTIAAQKAQISGLTQAVAVLADDQGDRLQAVIKQLEDAQKEANRIRVQFVGPRPS